MITHKITYDPLLIKFRLYGFFKNLKFFEPYLLIYLTGLGYNLIQIGWLIAIRGAITYIFEVPSAVIADFYGKKNELMACFIFYMMAFLFFFLGSNLMILALAMLFFGLGEAFRSGTHKAMILEYLERENLFEKRGYIYGQTRSWSLLGSSLSAFISIIFVLRLPALKWLFLISLVPYIIDFLLIATYPDYMNEKHSDKLDIHTFFSFGFKQFSSIFHNISLVKVIFSSSSMTSVFKVLKDYIQPILAAIILSSAMGTIDGLSVDDSLAIYLGLIYGLFYIFSSWASRNIYRVTERFRANRVFETMYTLTGLVFLLLSYTVHASYMIPTIFLYFLLYVQTDARRPVFLEVSSDHMTKNQRVTALSIESQIGAVFLVILAPLFGFITEIFSMSILFFNLGVLMLIANQFMKLTKENSNDALKKQSEL